MHSLRFASFIPLILISTACVRQQEEEVGVVEETYVHRYGVEVPSNFWSDSGQHGSVISSMSNGVVIGRSYTAGLLDGDTTYSYPHSSQIQKRETYCQGTMTKEVDYYFDGTPRREVIFDQPLGIKTVSSWYLSGTPRSIEQFSGTLLLNGDYYNTSNQRDGHVENYAGSRLIRDDYGQLLSTDIMQEGLMTLRTTYHSNGSPKEKIAYQNNRIHGTKLSFHPAGEPDTVEEWANGQQHGMTVLYQHGDKYAEIPYAEGKKQGVERHYRDGEKVVREISWQGGQLHGPSSTYVGETTMTDWYYNGERTTQSDYEFMVNRPVAR